jgi:hypothetical protein
MRHQVLDVALRDDFGTLEELVDLTRSTSSCVLITSLGVAFQTLPNRPIIWRACGRSEWVSTTTPPPRSMKPELASQSRFFSFRTAKQC